MMKINWPDVEQIIRDNPDQAGSGETCPAPEDLALLAEQGAGRQARKKMMKHVANCPDCVRILKSLLALSRQVDELTAKPGIFPRPVLEPISDRTKPAHSFLGRRLVIVTLASFVGLAIIAISVAKLPSPYALRGRARGIELIAPKTGALLEAGRIGFEWRAVPKASRYFVEIFGGSLELVWHSDPLYGPHAELPAGTAAAVQRGGTYFWRVTAVLADGQEIVSKAAKFSIRR